MGMNKRVGHNYEELEIEVQQCSSMILNPPKEHFWINLGSSESNRAEITQMHIGSGGKIICSHTRKYCVFHSSEWPCIIYSVLERCPSFKDSVVKYKVKGRRKEGLFYTFGIENIGV